MAQTAINAFEVMYSANKFAPRILLLNAGEIFAQLVFEPDGTVLPADGINGGIINLYYHLENFPHCIDLLRNQKPMFLWYNGSGGGFENGIKTNT